MSSKKDVWFKIGLFLQLLLIPLAFLWHFSSDAFYYNWILMGAAVVIVALSLWPQAIVVRVKRLKAIKLQMILVIAMLIISWLGYAYFQHFIHTNCTPSYALHNGSGGGNFTQADLGKNCYFGPMSLTRSTSMTVYSLHAFGHGYGMVLNLGISMWTALLLTVLFLALPVFNLYRYQIDKKRLQGIKKEELFV